MENLNLNEHDIFRLNFLKGLFEMTSEQILGKLIAKYFYEIKEDFLSGSKGEDFIEKTSKKGNNL